MSGSKRFNPPFGLHKGRPSYCTFPDFSLGIYFVYLSLSLILTIVPFLPTIPARVFPVSFLYNII